LKEVIIQHIEKELSTTVIRYELVQGGDINQCFCLFTPDNRYFLKVNDAIRFPQLFEKEAAGLAALRGHSTLVIPRVMRQGIDSTQQWLLLEWLEKKPPAELSTQHFGACLANLHQQGQSFFGWHTNNFIGSLLQLNTAHSNWADFYTECRIMPLAETLFNKGSFAKNDIELAASFCRKLVDFFPVESPALLHGDLWSGNYMITADGAALFDPAVYYGHREMDIGMTKLFGGFDQVFYEAYHERYPLEKGWVQRLPVTQLYPLLVHAVLFGEHYTESARQVLKKWG
jgi:fructosamine-3-kinase